MGSVYLAQHPRLPRQVALKLLNHDISTDGELRRRFEQEADLVARLDHPNIVDVYDRGRDGDRLWISMRFVPGTDAARLDPRTVTPERAVRIVTETAAALDYAHSRGVLHRDVKPANLLLAAPSGGHGERSYLTDFGIARLTNSDAHLTSTGTVTATIAYASPEQLASYTVDHRSDQYSLACTLFALLTGRSPFEDANPARVIAGHLSTPPPPITALRPGLPPALDAVLARAMAKQAEDRFASCADFAVAVSNAFAGQPVPLPIRAAPTVVYEPAPAAVTPYPAAPAPHQAAPGTAAPHLAAPGPGAPYRPDRGSAPPYPAYGYPAPGPIASARPRRPRRTGRWIAVTLVALLAIAGAAVTAAALNWQRIQDMSLSDWDVQERPLVHAFPHLISAKNKGTGWHGTYCERTSGPGQVNIETAIYCQTSGITLTIEIYEFQTPADAQAYLARAETYQGIQRTTASNPSLSGPQTLLVPGALTDFSARTSSSGVLYQGFPSDPDRDRFVLTFSSNTATSGQEILDQYWKQAPLGK
ncbi:serine/threonine protein kinase [Nocardia stercoris]|uniref:non-specific serine/threonine protein kinase n=2 Tax=Nocardia stercoris TaxID=2483361 RepID=A0A3M2L0E0_9NOCA|nr:serine/threonine protein kinase [Nocardia stercoris]